MKELKELEQAYLVEYDVHVNRYLTYAQIQQIADAVLALSKPDENGEVHDSWSEREQCIDMLVLYHATDIGKEKLGELSHDDCLKSGLIEAVRCCVENLYFVQRAIEYHESEKRLLAQFSKQLPDLLKPLEKVVNKYGNKTNEQSRVKSADGVSH